MKQMFVLLLSLGSFIAIHFQLVFYYFAF